LLFSVPLELICHPFCHLDVHITKSATTSCLHTGIEQSQLLRPTARQGGEYHLILYTLRSLAPLLTPITRGPQLTKYPLLNTFEQRTQVPKAYAVLGAVVLLTLFHFVNSLAGPVSSLIGWAVPAFLSFKALESPGHQDDIQWLTYWVVFGFFNFTESIALRLVLYYFPWYFAFKTIFIIWLQLPTFRVRPLV